MIHLQHNVVSLLYTIRGMIESHFSQIQEGRLASERGRLSHAESILKKVFKQSGVALRIMRQLNAASKTSVEDIQRSHYVSIHRAWEKALTALKERYDLSHIEVIEHIPEPFPRIRCNRSHLEDIFLP